MQLTTARLELLPQTTADAGFILALLNSPGWLKYIGDRNVRTLAEAEQYITERVRPQWDTNGFGYFTCRLKGTETIVGTCGIGKREQLDAPDLGFAFLPKYHQQGFAFEAAEAVMECCRKDWQVHQLQAFTVPYNHGSIRLLEKLGFTRSHSFTLEGDEETLEMYTWVE